MATTELTSANFAQNIQKEGITLVDFWAEWCGPCQMQGPVIEELAEERNDINVCTVDVDKEGSLAAQYAIANIPALALFKDGQMIKKMVGFHSREEIELALKGL